MGHPSTIRLSIGHRCPIHLKVCLLLLSLARAQSGVPVSASHTDLPPIIIPAPILPVPSSAQLDGQRLTTELSTIRLSMRLPLPVCLVRLLAK